jgi:hypothetical protein
VPCGVGGKARRSPVVPGGRSRIMHRGIWLPPAPLGSRRAFPPAPLDPLSNRDIPQPCPFHHANAERDRSRCRCPRHGSASPRSAAYHRLSPTTRGFLKPVNELGDRHAKQSRTVEMFRRRRSSGVGGGSASEVRVRVDGSLEEQAVAICPMHHAGTTAWDDRRAPGFTTRAT